MSTRKLSKKKEIVLLTAMVAVAFGVLMLMAFSLLSKKESAIGVGADGFSVFEKPGSDLGITKVVSKQDTVAALGKSAKAVDTVEKSGVMSFNGRLGQTATFPFTLPNGNKATVDVDVLTYKDKEAYDNDNVLNGTGPAGSVDGNEVRYMPAVSIGTERVYALLVTKDLKSYRFSISQPNSSAYIKEFRAQDILKQIISKSNL
ncbi:MAG: hypothetical protein WAS27_02145 [Candidatus Saccharimonadales bacterium]